MKSTNNQNTQTNHTLHFSIRWRNSFILLIALAILSCCKNHPNSILPVNLKCEYLTNPIGIDAECPRFTWQLKTEEHGTKQQAYRIFVDTDSVNVTNGKGSIWQSGTIKSEILPALYQGKKLEPFTKYFWSVQIKDEKGNWSAQSTIFSFETGLIDKKNWKGNWITDTDDYNLKPAPCFRKSFVLGKKVKTARAYIAAGGLYELYINGEKIGDHSLDPMYTRFDRRTLYVTYDVTGNLQPGENAIGVLLGNGWYNLQSLTEGWHFDKAPWRARPKFCLDLRITYEDDTQDIISSDNDWRTTFSPIIFNSIYTAEHYDARQEQPGWDQIGFDDSGWKNAICTGAPSDNITAQSLPPIRLIEEVPLKQMTRIDKNTYLYDFGRNISGVCRIKVKGASGTVIRLKHAERLGKDGRADQSNIDLYHTPADDSDPFQTDIFILKGDGDEYFMPRFNYKGFQYVEVSADQPIQLTNESLKAYFMHSDVPQAGSIHSSNPVLNKIWQAANASYLSNLFGYPTDCPQREKNGWTGDASINIETGLYNFDAITIYEKWLADHRDEQQANGVLPAIIPSNGWGYNWGNGPDWTSTIAIIPWNIYLFYGDTRILTDNYNNIRMYVDYIDKRWPSGITDWGLGDWVPVKTKTPKEFTSSVYYFVDATILAKAAKILGKQDDYEKYTLLAAKIKNAINSKYLDQETGIYANGSQTALSVPLQWGVVPDEMINLVTKNLSEKVKANNKHIDVGLLGTKAILNALSENGYATLAYDVATQVTFPSWGWWIINGATTFYENWDINAARDISMNHIMFGEINAWFYKALGGIFPDENQPGFKHVILKPNFVTGLEKFEATHGGPYGTILSSWERMNDTISYQVSIPPNSTATLYLDKSKQVLENGKALSENKFIQTEMGTGEMQQIKLSAGNYQFSILE